jgi:predicted P-loop ATPase
LCLGVSESKKLKAVITTKVDEFRRAYGREHEVLPRRTSFTMTTNEEEYLKDVTGNRRWWIIKIPFGQVVDIEWLKTNVDQLLFEAYHEAVVLKKPYWNLSKEVISTLETKHADSMEGYAWEKPIVRWYLNLSKDEQRDGVDHEMAYEAICNRNSDGEQILKMIDQKEKNQIGKIFRGVLKLKKDRKMVDGISEELYFPTDDTPKKENTGNFSKTYIKHSFDVNMFA